MRLSPKGTAPSSNSFKSDLQSISDLARTGRWARAVSDWAVRLPYRCRWSEDIKAQDARMRAGDRVQALRRARHVEMNTTSWMAGIWVDRDRTADEVRTGRLITHDEPEHLGLPTPTIAVRSGRGNWHFLWIFENPVHVSSRQAWEMAQNVQKKFRQRAGGDLSGGILVKNPAHPAWENDVVARGPLYGLRELASYVSGDRYVSSMWACRTGGEGSANPLLFNAARFWGMDQVRHYATAADFGAALRGAMADRGLDLPSREREAVFRSVEGWVWRFRFKWPNGYRGGRDIRYGIMAAMFSDDDDLQTRQQMSAARTNQIRRARTDQLAERAWLACEEMVLDGQLPTYERMALALGTSQASVRRHCQEAYQAGRQAYRDDLLRRSHQEASPVLTSQPAGLSSSVPGIQIESDQDHEGKVKESSTQTVTDHPADQAWEPDDVDLPSGEVWLEGRDGRWRRVRGSGGAGSDPGRPARQTFHSDS